MFVSKPSLSWEDVYRSSLDTNYKVSVSVGMNDQGEVKSTVAHLRRYNMNKSPTKDGITLKTIDLDAIMGSLDGEFSVYTPDHSITSHIMDDDTVSIEISGWGKTKSMKIPTNVYEKVRNAASGLRFILSTLAKDNKQPTAQKLVKMVTSHVRKNVPLFTNCTDAVFTSQIETVKSLVTGFLHPSAKALRIPKEMVMTIVGSEAFKKNAIFYNYNEEAMEDGFKDIIPTLISNELSEQI